jgi:hypothetical protein
VNGVPWRATVTTPETRACASSRRSGCESALEWSTCASLGSPVSKTFASAARIASLSPCASPVIATCSNGSMNDERAPRLGADAVDRGAHDDLEQCLAVEVRGERLADARHRHLQAPALAAQVGEAVLELARHLVELVAELGELVAPDGGHLGGEVAAAQAARGVQEAAHLAAQRARHDQGERQREQEEAGQQGAGDEAAAADLVGQRGPRREDGDLHALAEEAAALERVRPVLGVADLHLARPGRDVGAPGAAQRAREDVAADAHEHDVEARELLDASRVRGRGDDRDLEAAEAAAVLVEQPDGPGERRGRVADVDDRAVGAPGDHDPLRVLLAQEVLGAGLQRLDVVAADRRGERDVGGDLAAGPLALLDDVVGDADDRVAGRAHARVVLALLRVGDEREQHAADRDHRHHHDDHEEQPQPVAEAHRLRERVAAPPADQATLRAGRGLHWRALGAIAQLGERLDRTQEVGGSSPPSSIRPRECIGLWAGTSSGRFEVRAAPRRGSPFVTFASSSVGPSRSRPGSEHFSPSWPALPRRPAPRSA